MRQATLDIDTVYPGVQPYMANAANTRPVNTRPVSSRSATSRLDVLTIPNAPTAPPHLAAISIPSRSGPARDFDAATPAELRRAIDHAVSSVFGVGFPDLMDASRGPARVSLARQTAMYLAHTVGQLSLTDVGDMFGRDRTTVAHACAVVEDRRDDPNFDRALILLERAVVRLVTRRVPHCAFCSNIDGDAR